MSMTLRVRNRGAAVEDKERSFFSGPAEERYPVTMRLRPWEAMRAFWGVRERFKTLGWMTGIKHSSVYRLLEEFGDFGSGRKSDLHRVCEQVEYATAAATDAEIETVRAIAELPLRAFEAALEERERVRGLRPASPAELYDELLDVVRVHSHGQPWDEQRREMREAIRVLEQEIKCGDRRADHCRDVAQKAS